MKGVITVDGPHPVLKDHPLPALGEGTNPPISPHIPVGEGLVPSRGDNAKMISLNPGRHKTGPYDVVMIDLGEG